jgi:hypothetical protein
LSFEKFSNCGWSKELAFVNGGIGVHLLKLDMSKISESKQTVDAYKEIDALEKINLGEESKLRIKAATSGFKKLSA